jgi:hypothetical protein
LSQAWTAIIAKPINADELETAILTALHGTTEVDNDKSRDEQRERKCMAKTLEQPGGDETLLQEVNTAGHQMSLGKCAPRLLRSGQAL